MLPWAVGPGRLGHVSCGRATGRQREPTDSTGLLGDFTLGSTGGSAADTRTISHMADHMQSMCEIVLVSAATLPALPRKESSPPAVQISDSI